MMDDVFIRFARSACQLVSRSEKKKRAVAGDKWEGPIRRISNIPGPRVPAHTEISCSLTIPVSVSDYTDLPRSPFF